jgi:hypothetical protein
LRDAGNELREARESGLPYDVTVDDSSYLYIADGLNNRIQKFGPIR